MKKKWIVLLFVIIMVIPACTILQSSDEKTDENQKPLPPNKVIQEPTQGGKITVGLDIKNLVIDPLGLTAHPSSIHNLNPLLYRGLFKYDNQLQLTTDLAESIEYKEEEKEILVRLKDGLKWQDRTPLTIEDVQYTIEWYSKGIYQGKWKPYTFHIEGVEEYRTGKSEHISGLFVSPENRSLTIKLKEINIKDVQLLTAPLLSKKQLEGKTYEEVKKDSLAGKLLANGPFKVNSVNETNWSFIRNDSFPDKVYLDEMIFKDIEEENQNYNLIFGLPQHANEKIRATRLETITGHGYYYLGMNLSDPKWKDQTMRKALFSVIQYDQLIKNVFLGSASKAVSPIHPLSWAHAKIQINQIPFEEAKNVLENKNLSLKLTFEDAPLQQQLAKELANQFNLIGVKIQLNPVPSDQYTQTLFSKGGDDLFIAGWPYELDPIEENEKWLEKNDVFRGGYNISHVTDKTSDKLLLEGSKTVNQSKRKELYSHWQEYFLNQYYVIPLASPDMILLEDPSLHSEIKNSLVPYADIETWWTEK